MVTDDYLKFRYGFFPPYTFELINAGVLLRIYLHIGFEGLSLECLDTLPKLYNGVEEQDWHPRLFT